MGGIRNWFPKRSGHLHLDAVKWHIPRSVAYAKGSAMSLPTWLQNRPN